MADKKIIEEKVKEISENGKVSCKNIFLLADNLNCKPADIGKTCNELKIKIINCQIGCF